MAKMLLAMAKARMAGISKIINNINGVLAAPWRNGGEGNGGKS
jgi:hypothetical protein